MVNSTERGTFFLSMLWYYFTFYHKREIRTVLAKKLRAD